MYCKYILVASKRKKKNVPFNDSEFRGRNRNESYLSSAQLVFYIGIQVYIIYTIKTSKPRSTIYNVYSEIRFQNCV